MVNVPARMFSVPTNLRYETLEGMLTVNGEMYAKMKAKFRKLNRKLISQIW